MTTKSGCILFIFSYILQCSSSAIYRNNIQDESWPTSLVDQFNSYVDQTIEIINKNSTTQTRLPFYITRGTWGYLILNVEYTLKLSHAALTGVNMMQRRGDAIISYNKSTKNLSIYATVVTEPVQANYTAEVAFYGRKHKGQVTTSAPGLTISVTLTVSSANLMVTLDDISIDSGTTKDPNVTMSTTDPVLEYFVPLITDTASGMTEATIRSSVQAVVNVFNSPDFGYY
ncbi:uncharacterized protein LOC128992665 [Macrosteles quadrilineatus]|uniref:uncharacterized protein LOC128992665 n=1 Tax=Macrosteles quadrilineatus TaxID=74068 RepID=UPI0023E2597B|nr:uncharacterized protein LOC128992665 [Macrosteles quadrilineatus]